MSDRLKAGKHLLLSCSALIPALLAAASPAHAQAVNLGGAGNLIIPDGRTQTSVSSSGATTDVRTGTVRGDVGFNSFSRFEAGAGNTVNLHLPDGTGTLVNIVRDAPVVVEGTVNSLKNGTIGGNVVFSDPYGFVLGKEGVINTGGLTVNTPTEEFLDEAIDGRGRIDTAKTDRLISGDVPLSPDGSVVIRGRVNAETHIDIHARSIEVDGDAVLKRHRENFEASVNTAGGVRQGGALVVRNGRISLVAAEDVKIGGSVAARATSRRSAEAGAGRIAIKAGRNVTVTPTARIEALADIAREDGPGAVAAIVGIEAAGELDVSGTLEARGLGGAGAAVNLSAERAAVKASALLSAQVGAGARRGAVSLAATQDLALDGRIEALGAEGTKGGRIDVRAGGDIAMGGSASLDAGGAAGSAGGDVALVATRDFSGADGATVSARGSGDADGGFAELSGHRAVSLGALSVDLRSDGSGKAGHLFVDPADLTISNASTWVRGAAGSLIDNVGSVEIATTNSITVANGGKVDAGGVDLVMTSRDILIASGGSVRGRTVTINAQPLTSFGVTLPAGSASIIVAGKVSGGAVTLTSTDLVRIAALGIVETESGIGGTQAVAIAGRTVETGAGSRITAGTIGLEASRQTFLGAATLLGDATISLAGALNARTITGEATDAVDVQAGSVLTGTGAAGLVPTISLTSRAIDVRAGAQLAGGSGDVVLSAVHTHEVGALVATAEARVTIAGSVTGRNLVATATATASSQPGSPSPDDPTAIIGNKLVLTALGMATGFNAGYMAAHSKAIVTVAGTASIDMTGDVTLAAAGMQSVSTRARVITQGKPAALSVFVGEIDAETSAAIESGATVKAGNKLAVTARNDALVKMKSAIMVLDTTVTDAAVAVGVTDVATSALVKTGANISAASLSVLADNTNTFSVTAKSDLPGKGTLGVSLALQLSNTAATARLGADYGTDLAPGGAVTVAAINNTILNITKADASVGGDPVADKVPGFVKSQASTRFPGMLAASKGLLAATNFMPEGADFPTTFVKGSVSLALNISSHTADASIAADAGAATKPKIVSGGNVAVVSSVYDAPIRSASNAGVKETDDAAENAGAISGAVALVDHTSHATIGSGVSVKAANLGLSATSDAPIFVGFKGTALSDLASPKEFFKVAKGFMKVKGAVVDMIGTSFAGTQVKSEGVGIGASVNYLGISHDTRAWIASDAVINTTAATNGQVNLKDGTSVDGWEVTLDTGNRPRPLTPDEQYDNAIDVLGDFFEDGMVTGERPTEVMDTNARGSDKRRAFRSGVDLQAASLTETINIAGSPAWMVLSGGNAGKNDGTSAGGSANVNIFATSTIAGIGAGASVTSQAGVSAQATTRDRIYAITPSSGKGAGLGITGLVSVASLKNETHATISNAATVRAPRVRLDARQDTDALSLTGALVRTSGTGVGIAATWANLEASTSAFVGNNDEIVKDTDVANRAGAARGSVTTDDLAVNARTAGEIIGLSVAAAISAPEDGKPGLGSKIKEKVNEVAVGGLSKKLAPSLMNGVASSSKIKKLLSGQVIQNLNKLSDKLTKPAKPVSRDFAFSGAGSITGATTAFDTQAYLDAATAGRLSSTGALAVAVDAANDLLISTTSGAASLALAGQSSAKTSAAVAGAVAVAASENRTYAGIRNGSILTDLGQTRVRAIGSGQQIVLGLGLAANTNANSSVSIAGSISFGFVFDNVNAAIDGSTLTAVAGGSGDLAVKAYQNTDIGIGGLAVSVATQGVGGFGLALTGTIVGDSSNPLNPDNRKAVSASVSNSSIRAFRDLTVDAATLSRIMSGAGAIGVAPNGLGLTGSIVFNDVSSTTSASITGRGASDAIDVTGSVVVRSGSVRDAAIAAEIAGNVRNAAIATGFDFSKSALDAASTGSVIFGLSVAGSGGKNAGGISLLYNGVRHAHEAKIDGVDLDADGDVTVSAKDDTKIIGTAAGVSVATGEFGGAGSIVVAVVANRTDATVSGASTTLDARDIKVLSSNTSSVAGGAGSVGIGASAQGTGLGLSLINGTIANKTTATVERASLTATREVALSATSRGDIMTFAVSVGAGGTVGIAGSVATSVAANDAKALVKGAIIAADNNVVVAAENADTINAVSGAIGVSLKAAGVGLSTVANVVRGETVAAIEGSGGVTSQVTARGRGTAAQVDDGTVRTAYDYTNAANIAKALVALTPDLSNGTRAVSGLSVGAVSRQAVGSFSLAAAIAINADTIVSVAGAVAPVVNVLGGKTEARIVGADINRAASSDEADVAVTAASNTFVQNAVIAAAGSTGAAGAAGFVSNVMERETNATVTGARIGMTDSVGAVDVRAAGIMDSVNLVAGLSVGPVGGAGSMVVNVFDAKTLAQLSGGSVTAGSLAVQAVGDTGFLGAAGAGAAGGTAVAGAMNIAVNLGSTQALVGAADADTTLVLDTDLTVEAKSRDEHRTFVVGGALSTGGGGYAVAGMLNFSVLMSDTIASVNRLAASSMRNVSVKATNVVDLLPVTGGFSIAVDGAGIGAAANVMLVKSKVGAEVLNSAFTARGTLDVQAFGERRNSMVTATLGAGGSVGIGASLGIFVAGIGMSDDAKTELGNTLGSANDQSSQSVDSSFGGSGTAAYRQDAAEGKAAVSETGTKGGKISDANSLRRQNLVSSAVASTKRDEVTATIAGSTITAGATTVLADSKLQTANTAFGAGIGGLGGVGAALGFSFVEQNVAASVNADLTASALSVSALSGAPGASPAVSVKAYAGAGGLAGALGAAVAVARLESSTHAAIGGTVTTAGAVQVKAEDKLSVASEAVGATASGGIAIGVSLAVALRDAAVTAELAANGVVDGAQSVSIAATAAGSASAKGIAGAGGLLGAGVGASGTAVENSDVLARIGAGGRLSSIGAGGVEVAAKATPGVSAESLGVAIAGQGAVGASLAIAKADLVRVRALVDKGATIGTSGSFKATADLVASGDSLYAKSTAGAGALFLSAQASIAQALMTGLVEASIAADPADTRSLRSSIQAGGDVSVKATSRTRQTAEVFGVAASGGLALGATVAEAKSDVTTRAKTGARVAVGGANLTVSADGADENTAGAVSGAGGLIAGSAAAANTVTKATTEASLGGGSAADAVALTGKLTVAASHLATVASRVNSVNAGIAGMSGAMALHEVTSSVTASVADGAYVDAANLEVTAANRTHRLFAGEAGADLRTGQPLRTANNDPLNPDTADWTLMSGSGGILNLPAGTSRLKVSHTTSAGLGTNARVRLTSAGSTASQAVIAAYNELIAHDKVKLDSGGAIALADTRSYVDVTKNEASVAFGAGSSLVLANGSVNAAAFDNAHIDLRAVSTTYGLAGAPTGAAEVDYRRANLVSLAKGALIEASNLDDGVAGSIRLAAGAGPTGTLSRIVASATVDLFNKTAIPIPTVPNPIVRISGDSILSIAGEANGLDATNGRLRAAGDITLIASRGQIDARAVGTGKDIYREGLAAIASGVSELFGGGKVSFDYKGGDTIVSGLGIAAIDGSAETGIRRTRSLLVEYATADIGACIVSTTACISAKIPGQIDYTYVGGKPIATAIIERLKELRAMLADYNSDPVARGAFAAEITFLEARLVAAGFSKDGTPGAAYGKTPFELATSEISGLGTAIDARDTLFSGNTAIGKAKAGDGVAAATSLGTDGQSLLSKIDAAKSKADAITGELAAFDGFDASASQTDTDAIAAALVSNATLAGDIGTERGKIAASRTAITNAKDEIDRQLGSITADRNSLRLLGESGNAASIQALQDRIATSQDTIRASMATIETELAAIETAAGVIAGKQAAVDGNLVAIVSAQTAIRDRSGSAAQKSSVSTKLGELGTTRSGITTDFGKIGTGKASVTTAVGGLTPIATSDYASPLTLTGALAATRTQRIALVGNLATLRASLPTLSKTNPNAPTTGELQVADATVRLGSIAVTADRLEGTGALVAPGDGSIEIVNRTANNLVVGNLTILSDSGGKISLNGALVDGSADINALNKAAAGRSGAQFRAVTTARNQGGQIPTVSIRNEYSSYDTSYYNPDFNPALHPEFDPTSPHYVAAVAAQNPFYYKGRAFYAPDLVTKRDTYITNVTGSVAIKSAQGNIYSNGTIQARSVSITAKNGDFVQSYTYGFEHVKGDPQTGTPQGTGIIANGAVAISARYLNINGLVQSGMAERFVTIGTAPVLMASGGLVGTLTGNAKTTLDLAGYDQAYKDDLANNRPAQETRDLGNGLTYRVAKGETPGQLEFDIAYAQAHAAALGDAARLVEVNATGSARTAAQMKELIGVTYDITNDRFVVDGTNVRGGQIQIYGQILNTSTDGSGKLRVLDGFGQIKIANLSSRDVVVSRLDTGEDRTGTGRGVAGTIDITDIRGVTPGAGRTVRVDAVQTSYRRELDTATNAYRVVMRTVVGTIGSDGTFQAATDQTGYGESYGSDRAASYDPQKGLRYLTLTGEDSSSKQVTHYKGLQFFGSSDLRTAPSGEVVSSYSYTRSKTPLPDAATVAVDLAKNDVVAFSTTPPAVATSDTTYVKIDEWRDCNWWTLCIAASYHYVVEATTPKTTITTLSTKANNPIGVEFMGLDRGRVEISSVGNVILNGPILNESGSTSVTSSAEGIRQGNASALITSRSIELDARKSVGALGLGNAVQVTLAGGALDAASQTGNVVVSARSDLNVGTIKAGGDATHLLGRVVLTAAKSITGTGSSLIQAPRVELNASAGSIGRTGGLLTVNTGFTSNATYRPFGDPLKDGVQNAYYGLKAQAAGDIGIESKSWTGNATGTILLDQVVSSGGNVTLKTAGAILDNNPIQSIDTRTYNELVAYWDSLSLRAGAANADKTTAVIKAFETQVATDRRTYGQLLARAGTTVYDKTYSYAMTSAERQGFEASLTLADPTLNATQLAAKVASFEAGQTARYHDTHAALATLTGTFDTATGAYTASAAEKAARTSGAVWTERELAFSVSPGALKTVTGTNPVLKAANVSGRVVTLDAGAGLGEVVRTVEIPIGLDPSQLRDDQKIALATAERSDFLTRTSGDPIRIRAIRMLNFDAATRLDAEVTASGGNAYLATNGDARLGAIEVPGELRVKARGSIVNAGGDIAAGSYILEASGGGIGWSRAVDGTPVAGTLRLKPVNTGGSLAAGYKGTIVARAADSVDLSVAGDTDKGDANLDTVYSRKTVKVVADRSIRNANGGTLINVLGTEVVLEAKNGSVGASGNRLNVGNGLGGVLDASASGSIHLFAPDGNHLDLRTVIASGGLLSVVAGDASNPASAADVTLRGMLSAATSVDLVATGRLAALGGSLVRARGGDLLANASSVRMLTGSGFEATGRITLTAAGDALVTGLKADAAVSDAVRITAGGAILAGTADGRTDILTTAAGAGVVLAAGTGIGDRLIANDQLGIATSTPVANPLRVKTDRLDAQSGLGDVDLALLSDADAVLRANGGSIDVEADGRFGSTFVAAQAGSVRLRAKGAVDIATLSAGDAAEVTSLGSMGIDTATVGRLRLVSGGSLRVDTVRATGAVEAEAQGAMTVRDSVSGGAQRLSSKGTVDIQSLSAGDAAEVTSLGSMGIDTATVGRLKLVSGGSIRLDTVRAAGAVEADAQGTLALRDGLSGGTQRLSATGDLVFDHLRTLGIAADAGDIYLTSREASVLGGEAQAARDLVIVAKNAIGFSKLRSVRDMSLTAGGALKGRDLEAGGELFFDVGGSEPISLATLRGKTLKMSSGGPLEIGEVFASESATLEAPRITIGTLTYTGLDQLVLALRGYRGAVAEQASMHIAAPGGIRMEDLRVADSRFTTDAANVQVISGYVPGTFRLVTPQRTVWMDNRSSQPVLGNDIQLFKPDFAFGLDQGGNRTTTTSYVVRYGNGTNAQMVWNGEIYPGSSFVRDFERAMQDPSNDRSGTGISQKSLTRMTVEAIMSFFRNAAKGPVSAPLDGPAVQTGEKEQEEAALR